MNNPKDVFYCTSNIFFSDEDVLDRLKLPHNIKFVSEEFRKFPQNKWQIISIFLQKERIDRVINLRYIGKKFEKDYFDFKKQISSSGMGVAFFDSEDISFNKKALNVRQIILKICEKAIDRQIVLNYSILKDIFPVSQKKNYIFVNMHSRGDFKLWNINKWTEIISSMVFLGKVVRIYGGYNDKEKEYVRGVLGNLSEVARKDVEVVFANNVLDLISFIQEAKVLISVDSGLVHLADALGVESIGVYITTSPQMWGGVTEKFYFVKSKHLSTCLNFYPQFGMCMNHKKKCDEVGGENDDVDVKAISSIVDRIYEEKN